MVRFVLLFLAIPLCLQASVICVDDDNLTSTHNGSKQYPYSSIQAAITNAMDNDSILVAVGTYGKVENLGKPLKILGGYPGGNAAAYAAGMGGNFTGTIKNPAMTIISGGANSIGVNLTRFSFDPFSLVLDNFTVRLSAKGIVCDVEVSWPHVDYVTLSNNIIENNGQPGITSYGAGILVAGNHNKVLNNIIRNNRGGRGAGLSGNFSLSDSLLVEGNLIENNTGYDDHGAGVYLGGFVTLKNNIIAGNYLQNSYGWGGGVLILGTAHMSFNIIKDNFCPSYGAGVFVDEGATAYMDHELIYNNYTSLEGAGIAVDNSEFDSSHIYVTNCTIVNNYSPEGLGGNAIFLDNSSFATLKNCIITGNGDDFFINSSSGLTMTYSLSQEGFPGQGNFTADPLFADTFKEDFHLTSIIGRYDPILQNWVADAVHSPAIDAGYPTSAYQNEPAPNGKRINLGCYGNTAFASKSNAVIGIQDIVTTGFDISVAPNPFSSHTTIRTDKNFAGATLTMFDSLGRKIKTVNNIYGQAVTLHRDNLANGVYFFRLTQGAHYISGGKLIVTD